MENKEKNEQGQSPNQSDAYLHDIILKQYKLMMEQFESLRKLQEKEKEREGEIDLLAIFRRKKKKSEGQVAASEQETSFSEKAGHAASEFGKKAGPVLADAGAKTGRFVGQNAPIVGKGIYKGSVYFLHMLARPFELFVFALKRFAVVVVLFSLMGLAYGIYNYLNAEKIYGSYMVVDSGNIKSDFYLGIVKNLGNLVKSRSYNGLANKINISEEDAALITKIEYTKYDDFFTEFDRLKQDSVLERVTNYPFFQISVNVKDNRVLPKLQNALFSYLLTNPYVSKTREVKKKVLEEGIQNLDNNLQTMDSLKMAVIQRIKRKKEEDNRFFVKESGIGTQGGIILSQEDKLEVNPMVPFERALQIEQQQLRQKEQLLSLTDNDFKIIDGFSQNNQPVYPRLKHIVYNSLIGFGIGSLISYAILMLVLLVRGHRKQKA